MIHPTEPEPLCDIEAQLTALRDPAHPKRAVWVSGSPGIRENPRPGASPASRGNPDYGASSHPLRENPICGALHLPVGTLYGSPAILAALAAHPDDETLARLLDYIEPKSALGAGLWPVVQALNRDGCVIFEAVSSWRRIAEARARAQCFVSRGGTVRVVSIEASLERRRMLIAQEGELLARIKEGISDAQRQQGRPG